MTDSEGMQMGSIKSYLGESALGENTAQDISKMVGRAGEMQQTMLIKVAMAMEGDGGVGWCSLASGADNKHGVAWMRVQRRRYGLTATKKDSGIRSSKLTSTNRSCHRHRRRR